MAQAKLTKREVDRLRAQAKASGKVQLMWCTDLRGFGCRASPKGATSWLVQKWVGGRGGASKRVTIGKLPSMSLEQAQREAAITIGDVHRGVDVVSRKERQRLALREAAQAIELGQTVESYLKRRSLPGRFWAMAEARLNTEVIAKLGKATKVASITRRDIRKLIEDKEAKSQSAARTLFETLRPFFKWCVSKEIIDASPMDDLTIPEVCMARDRVLGDEEIKAVWEASGALGYPFGPFYRLLLLTAARRDEVAGMTRDEIDGSIWTIPGSRTKNGKAHIVHLSPQAIEVLESLPNLRSRYLFTSTLETPISGYSKAKVNLDKAMGPILGERFKDWRVHDLRRTAASGMARLGFQPHIIERVLNHVSGVNGGLVSVYQRFDYLEERKRAIEAWGSHVESTVAETTHVKTNVVPFKFA